MKDYFPLREKPVKNSFNKGDVLVLFGELFSRGYANGLVEQAEAAGMTIVRATVGRRDENHNLRQLTAEESEKIPKPFINIPLEAGFDFDKDSNGQAPNDFLKNVKLSEWQNVKIPQNTLDESRAAGRKRFFDHTTAFIKEVEKLVKPNQHIHFAHLMAGGVPRTKIVMPLMNRVFKGTGDRFLDSREFWKSGIGQFVELNFLEVTARTFDTLIETSTALRQRQEAAGGSVSYVAYGYHGTEVVVNGKYHWQSYAPYLQGWAKMALEDFSTAWHKKGVRCCVYNCPEILTNSSSIFQGVEIPLYNLIRALDKEISHDPIALKTRQACESVLKEKEDLNKIFKWVDEFVAYSEKIGTSKYENWPQHSNKEQLALALQVSEQVIDLHKDPKNLMTAPLSELIFKACGYVMLNDGFKPQHPVAWIGHDVVAKSLHT